MPVNKKNRSTSDSPASPIADMPGNCPTCTPAGTADMSGITDRPGITGIPGTADIPATTAGRSAASPMAEATPVPPECRLASYYFDLPERLIAQYPSKTRESSRLLLLDKHSGQVNFSHVHDLAAHLPANSLLVANNTRVFPARLPAVRESGGKAEFLIMTPLPHIEQNSTLGTGQGLHKNGTCKSTAHEHAAPLPGPGWQQARVRGLVRPAKRLKPGATLSVSPDLRLQLIEFGTFGQADAWLQWHEAAAPLRELLARHGKIPLPPYIRRESELADSERYQTRFSKAGQQEGSVAAPTAGLHFTEDIIASLKAAGHDWTEVTLHVGYGTFSPVRVEDIRQHDMHSEWYTIPEDTARAVSEALAQKRPVIAIGTTSARTLEGAFALHQGITPHSGATNIFIYPGYRFNVLSGLFTNFHLPESTLLMLVSALTGRENLFAAYTRAIEEDMRFFSYGDAMLIT